MRDPKPELELGSMNLTPRGAGDSLSDTFDLYALSSDDDTTWGNPEPVRTVVESLLGDGSLVTIDRDDNRDAVIGIEMSAVDGLALAEAEAALVAECQRRNTLTWTPPDGWAPVTVFDVITSWLEHVFSDEDENRLTRRYRLHLVLYPHSRSLADVAVAATGSGVAPGAPPTEVVVTNADTTAGFYHEFSGGSVVDNGDFVSVAEHPHPYLGGVAGIYFDIGAVTDFSATPLLIIDFQSMQHHPIHFRAYLPPGIYDGANELTLITHIASPLGGAWQRLVFDAAAYAGSVQWIRFVTASPNGPHVYEDLHVTRIAFSDGNAAYSGTTRQLFRSMQVVGSARSQASVQLSHVTDNLGEVLVWTGPQDSAPPLRSYRFAGGLVNADSNLVSGAHEAIQIAAFVADVPIARVPEATYAVMARLATDVSPGTRTVEVTAQTRVNGADVGPAQTFTTVITTTDTDWHVHMLGTLVLPSTLTRSTDAVVRITLDAPGLSLWFDEGWLFNITEGSLTWIPDVPAKNLWLDQPTIDDPRPRLWAGATADKSDAYDITSSAQAWGIHDFSPGYFAALTVTTGAENAAMSATYPPRWHTHAAS